MYSRALFGSALLSILAAAVHSQATPANQPLVAATDIEGVIPTDILSPAVVSCLPQTIAGGDWNHANADLHAPTQDTSIAAFANGFVASVTAAPEFTSVVSVLATAIPVTAEDAIASDPEGFILNLLQGSSLPSWVTALPPSVGQYIESVGIEAAQQFTQDLPGVYQSLSAEVAALETGAVTGGGFAVPSGGYGGSNYSYAGPSASASGGPGASPIPFVPGSAAPSMKVGGVITAVLAAGFGAGVVLML